MNILIYTQKSTYEGFSVGGAETSLRLLAEKLAGCGHKVIYLTETTWGRLPTHETKTVNGVEVHVVGFPDLPSLGIGFLLRIRQKVVAWSFNRLTEKLVKEHEIDVIHAYQEVPQTLRFLKLREKKSLDYRVVLRMGGKYWEDQLKLYPERKEQYRYVYENVESIIFNTPGMQKLFEDACSQIDMEVTLKSSHIHDIGVEKNSMDIRWRPPGNAAAVDSEGSSDGNRRTEQPFTMIMASRFTKRQKRQDLLLQALAILPDDIPARLYLVGDGPRKDAIKKMSVELGIDHKIEFIPYMEQRELWNLMSECHLYSHACDFEGLSKIIIEAMGMGMPVLASDVVPLNDYLVDGHNGYLVGNSPQAWADKITDLSRKRHSQGAVSANAREYVEKNFDADQNVKEYIDRFGSLVKSRGQVKSSGQQRKTGN